MERAKLGLVLFALVGLAGLYLTRDGLLRRPAPDFSLPGVYGDRFDLDSYRGRPVLLVFWTTSCPICQRELPLLSQLEPSFRSRGVSLLAIHIGGEGDAADYLSSNRVNLTAASDSDGGVARAYHVSGVPKLVLIDREGKVKRSTSGWTSESVLRRWMDVAGGS
jgi:peroxiredoxin